MRTLSLRAMRLLPLCGVLAVGCGASAPQPASAPHPTPIATVRLFLADAARQQYVAACSLMTPRAQARTRMDALEVVTGATFAVRRAELSADRVAARTCPGALRVVAGPDARAVAALQRRLGAAGTKVTTLVEDFAVIEEPDSATGQDYVLTTSHGRWQIYGANAL